MVIEENVLVTVMKGTYVQYVNVRRLCLLLQCDNHCSIIQATMSSVSINISQRVQAD